MTGARVALALLVCAACDPAIGAPPAGPDAAVLDAVFPDGELDAAVRPLATLRPLFATGDLGSCTYASPVLATISGEPTILSVTLRGRIVALDPRTGQLRWEARVPAQSGAEVQLLSTPAIVEDRLMVTAWQELSAPRQRSRHVVMVFDLASRAPHPDFELLEVSASLPTHRRDGQVVFESQWQLQRAALIHRAVPDRTDGLVYLAFGNGPSEQPFHGWLFELDLDRWRAEGAARAIANVLLTTAETDCGPPGNRNQSVCGGGIWSSSGPQIIERPGGDYEILIGTGNGRVDFDVGAYAHSVIRTRRGLALETGCDPGSCSPFDELDPSAACLESCRDLFVARLAPGDPPLAPEDGSCDGLTFLECYGVLDADLGANAPVRIEVPGGPAVIVQAGKDGALYLVDAEHMGRLHQRLTVRDLCGTPTDPCVAPWAGTFVTRPAVALLDGDPVFVLASLMSDRSHASAFSAYRVVMRSGEPRIEPLWDVPALDSPAALTTFREHPGVPVIVEAGGELHALVVEVRRSVSAPPGILWAVRLRDGAVAAQQPLAGSGVRFAWPLVEEGRVYVASCGPDAWTTGRIEAFELGAR